MAQVMSGRNCGGQNELFVRSPPKIVKCQEILFMRYKGEMNYECKAAPPACSAKIVFVGENHSNSQSPLAYIETSVALQTVPSIDTQPNAKESECKTRRGCEGVGEEEEGEGETHNQMQKRANMKCETTHSYAYTSTVLEVETWQRDAPYDLISCLNVLDRCSRPVSLLHDIREALRPRSGQPDHRPEEYLPISGEGFEAQVSSAFEVFSDAGFEVERWTRVPYLCEGDLGQSFYWLDDAVFVLSPLA
ncbi:hypothetical protein B566_EDAN004968 [Ephemera danica]|nr:hypothetical protein B566_EDAN004968 [Ephemera danica]